MIEISSKGVETLADDLIKNSKAVISNTDLLKAVMAKMHTVYQDETFDALNNYIKIADTGFRNHADLFFEFAKILKNETLPAIKKYELTKLP